MVAKVDESEALAGWRFRSILILVLVIALLAFLFTAIGVVWQKTGKAHYQELFLAETALRKVVKELSCLYGISKLMERQGISLEEILQGVVDIIPGSWQYPETTHARVILEGREFKTENFADAVWKQSADIVAYGDRIGSLEVGYAEERPESDEGPFLKEERYLLNAIVERLVHVIEHKRAEEALQASEEHHRILIEHIPQHIFLKDHNSVYLSCNANYASTLGIAPEQIVGKDDFAFHPPELAQGYRADDQECMATGMLKDIEEPYQLAGQDRWIHTIKVPYRDRKGQVIGVLGIFEDITERKQVEEALRESEERFRMSAKSLSDVIYEWDLGNSVKWFGNIDGLLGYAPGGFPHTLEAWIDILHPEDRDRVWKEVEKQLRDDTTYDIEYRVQHKEGGWRDWAARGAAVKDASGKPLRWIGAVTDITDRKRNEELALQSARLKSVADLSSGVAHHFNNLLQIVIGNTSLSLADLESGDLSEIKTNLERMLGAATRGAEMVKRLQTFANMGADVTERESEVFDATTTAGNAAEVFKPVWISDPEKKGIKIDLKLDLEDRCLVKGQETEIFEVIVNLIRNAAEALPKGGDIEVKTYREANEVVVTIRDTGTGIAEEDLSRVFQPFWSSKGVGIGKGMGLAVTHGLVKRHGGTISVDSKVGVGTTFTIRLPLAHEPVTKTEQSSMSTSGDRLTILVIDDDLSIATLLERICAKAGHTVFRALSGQEGLAIFNKETVDLVISDLGMPGMNGWDVGKAIQSICQERGVSKPPFILLTAWGGQELEKEKIAESGTDAVVAKPIDRATVLATVQEITARFTIGSRVP